MKKIMVQFVFAIFMAMNVFALEVEKLGNVDINYTHREPAQFGPYGISVDETDEKLKIHYGYRNICKDYLINHGLKEDTTERLERGVEAQVYLFLGDVYVGINDEVLEIRNSIGQIKNNSGKLSNGISFILKKNSGYIIYYVNEEGIPGAVDTTGRVYSNTEAMKYLQEYDKDKFEGSRKRAQELGLLKQFDSAAVLVWEKTYYSTVKILEKFWGKCPYVNYSNPIQYDEQGNGYQSYFDGNWGSIISSADTDGQRFFCLENVNEYSDILKGKSEYYIEHQGEAEPFNDFSASMYVGFGGNIYYYIAGEGYTEVFRIRRTWGAPDFYAMAVNGWTDDGYGRYADELLSKLSKADLRLLRNTVYALYGYHFNSRDLASRFDKEVWYTDKGLAMDHIQLPEHRQRLVEKIQALEAGK